MIFSLRVSVFVVVIAREAYIIFDSSARDASATVAVTAVFTARMVLAVAESRLVMERRDPTSSRRNGVSHEGDQEYDAEDRQRKAGKEGEIARYGTTIVSSAGRPEAPARWIRQRRHRLCVVERAGRNSKQYRHL